MSRQQPALSKYDVINFHKVPWYIWFFRIKSSRQIFEAHTLEFINLANKRCKDYVRHFIDEEKIVNINHDDFVKIIG